VTVNHLAVGSNPTRGASLFSRTTASGGQTAIEIASAHTFQAAHAGKGRGSVFDPLMALFPVALALPTVDLPMRLTAHIVNCGRNANDNEGYQAIGYEQSGFDK
jgi:hypothetical protein